MDAEGIKEQLEAVLGSEVQIVCTPKKDWIGFSGEHVGEKMRRRSLESGDCLLVELNQSKDQVLCLRMNKKQVSPSERRLIEMLVETLDLQDKKQKPAVSKEQRKAEEISEWMLKKAEQGVTDTDLPDALASQVSFYSSKIPLLLYGDYSSSYKVTYEDLKKLLESFFDADICLIPLLDKEWFILAPESLLTNAAEREEGEEENIEQTLDALVLGLHEMLANEWVGESHLAIHYPIKPVKSLLKTMLSLRETIMVGRTNHVSSYIHMTWKLRLEGLLHKIPAEEKAFFLEQVLGGIDHVLDTETQTTLEQFFGLDCNVSETAKKLYIHRNTLLYRLDKFKQETSLDVRNFHHAVLVKIALLLYKVTNRK